VPDGPREAPGDRRPEGGPRPPWQQDRDRGGDARQGGRPPYRAGPPFRGGPPGGRGGGGYGPRPRPFGRPPDHEGFDRPRREGFDGPRTDADAARPDHARRDRPGSDRFRPDRPAYGRPAEDRPWADRARPDRAFRPAVPPPDLLADDEELVAGRRPVEEAFVARRPAHRLFVVPQRRQALERLVLHATSLRIPVVEVEGGTLTALAGFDGHQGIALAVEPRVYAGIDDVLARAVERGEPPFVLVLDSLEDPQNVGTLLRTAEAAGVHGVLFPTHRQAPLSPAAIKASAGAVEHLLLCPVDDLPGAMSDLRVRGLRIAAAEADAPLTAAQADLRGPLAIVIGSEGQGLSPAMRRRSDIAVRIPMRGAIGSLNAAVAGSILLYAAVAQRDPGGIGDHPARPAGADAWPVRDEPVGAAGGATGPGPAKGRRGQSVVVPASGADAAEPAAPAAEPAALAIEPAAPRRRKTASKSPQAAEAEPAPEAQTDVETDPGPKTSAKRGAIKVKPAGKTAKSPASPKPAAAKSKPAAAKAKPATAKAKPVTVKAKPTAAKTKPARSKGASTRTPARARKAADAPSADPSDPDGLLPGGPEPS